MTTQTAQAIQLPIAELAIQSYSAFCDDIAGMFGCSAQCELVELIDGTAEDLKKHFKKLASVNYVQAQGALNGTFDLIFDQGGMFVLAGIFVMLPENRILETIRNGTLKDADYIYDAIKEVGNLLVGSWDRIWRENTQTHRHFKQTGTFVGSLWQKPQDSLKLDAATPCVAALCKMSVDAYPEFLCAALFAKSIFSAPQADTEPVAGEPNAAQPTAPKAQPTPPAPAAQAPVAMPQPAAPAAATPSASPTADTPAQPATAAPKDTPAAAAPEPTTPENPGPVATAIRQLIQSDQSADASSLIAAADAWALKALTALRVSDWMRPCVIWIEPQQTIEEAVGLMQRHNIGYLMVGKDSHLEAILSRSDVALAISPYLKTIFAQWRRPQDDASMQIRVSWFASRPVHTIAPDAPLVSAAEKMLRHGIRSLPVMDAAGKVVGILTAFDILAGLCALAGVSLKGIALQVPPTICAKIT